MKDWLIYGANGYSGRLIARLAVERGHKPILAGRSAQKVEDLARDLGLPSRAFSLDDPAATREGLAGVAAVVHAAGPFSQTARPMVEACLDRRAHYLDITGEVEVFEAIADLDGQAREGGVVLLPGAGFDVVPSDCLAAMLAARVPEPRYLDLAIRMSGGPSAGTARTMVEGLGKGGLIRRDGRLERVLLAADTITADFPSGRQCAVGIPWGDLSTSFRSTGIPNIRTFMGLSAGVVPMFRLLGRLGPLLQAIPGALRLLDSAVSSIVRGPTYDIVSRSSSELWAEVRNDAGQAASAGLRTPNGYALTAATAVESVLRILAGGVQPGFQTPSRAFGPRYALEFPGVELADRLPT